MPACSTPPGPAAQALATLQPHSGPDASRSSAGVGPARSGATRRTTICRCRRSGWRYQASAPMRWISPVSHSRSRSRQLAISAPRAARVGSRRGLNRMPPTCNATIYGEASALRA